METIIAINELALRVNASQLEFPGRFPWESCRWSAVQNIQTGRAPHANKHHARASGGAAACVRLSGCFDGARGAVSAAERLVTGVIAVRRLADDRWGLGERPGNRPNQPVSIDRSVHGRNTFGLWERGLTSLTFAFEA